MNGLERISDDPCYDTLRDFRDLLGACDVAPESEQGVRALGLAPLGLVQAGVLECDGRVPCEHLEHAQVVGVELVEPELGDDDHAVDARAELERNREHRLLDLGRTRDLLRELAVCGVADDERLAGLGNAAGDAATDDGRLQLGRSAGIDGGQVATKGDGQEVVPVADEHAAVVVVDEESQLVGDREPDPLDVVQPRQLPGQALEHLEVGDRANVVPCRRLGGPLRRRLVEGKDEAPAASLRRHHRRLRAGDELARVGGMLRADGDPARGGEATDRLGFENCESGREALGERRRARDVAGREDDRELLAPDTADDVGGADGGTEHFRHLQQELVPDAVSVHVVDLLEVVEVQHDERDGVVLRRRAHELLPHAVVERAVVVEPGERVGRRLVLERRPDVRVVECESGCVPETGREEELLVGELRVLSDAVDVERPLEIAARDERNGDHCLRIDGGARHEADPRVEMSLVREHRLAVLHRPARDALAEREALAHDLLGPLAPGQHGDQLALHLVGLVDVDVLVRNELRERVRDAVEQRVETLLGEDVVEDLRQAPIRLDGAQPWMTLPVFAGDCVCPRAVRRLDRRSVRHQIAISSFHRPTARCS